MEEENKAGTSFFCPQFNVIISPNVYLKKMAFLSAKVSLAVVLDPIASLRANLPDASLQTLLFHVQPIFLVSRWK
jgi:hypothetical protein